MSDVLAEEGFTVTSLSGGLEAISFIKSGDNTPDIVILDVLMPDISGTETYHRIRETHPNLPVLIYSGLEITPEINEIIVSERTAFLRKPFETEELQAVLKEILPG